MPGIVEARPDYSALPGVAANGDMARALMVAVVAAIAGALVSWSLTRGRR